MHLSPDDIAAAEACGVSFLPASDAQVQRLAMQRKVFYQAGTPILATRGDGFYETVGTLQQLIEEGRAQQRDLAQWLQAEDGAAAAEQAAAPLPAAVELEAVGVDPAPEPQTKAPAAEPEATATAADPAPEPEAADSAPPAPKRPRRRRPVAVIPWIDPTAAPEPEPDPEPEAAAPEADAAVAPARSAARVDSGALSAEERGKRWLMAGAARRGRAGKHWSTRQR